MVDYAEITAEVNRIHESNELKEKEKGIAKRINDLKTKIERTVRREFPYNSGVDNNALTEYNLRIKSLVDERYQSHCDEHKLALETMVEKLFQKAVNSGRTDILTLNGEPLPEDLALMTNYLRTQGFNASYRLEERSGGWSMTTKSDQISYSSVLELVKL